MNTRRSTADTDHTTKTLQLARPFLRMYFRQQQNIPSFLQSWIRKKKLHRKFDLVISPGKSAGALFLCEEGSLSTQQVDGRLHDV